MSDNIDNLLSDIYSSESQSQGVKELANLINNLSQLLLKAISQLENRVYKLEQQIGRGGGAISMPRAPGPTTTPTPAPAPWLMIGGIIAGLIVFGIIFWLIMRNREIS